MKIKNLLGKLSFNALQNRVLHYLWIVSPKSYETIKGIPIPYLKVSPFLLRKRLLHSKCSDGMVVHYRPKELVMIFITGSDRFWRYTIYHEYCEGKAFKERRNKEQVVEIIFSKIQLIQKALESPSLENFDAEQVKRDIEKMVDYSETDFCHLEALFEELLLAKEELTHNEFLLFRKDIITRLKSI